MKTLFIILVLSISILCKAQTYNDSLNQVSVFKLKTDSIEKAFNLRTKTIDTTIGVSDSIVVNYKNKDGVKIKDEIMYFYSGYIALTGHKYDSIQKKLYKDSSTLLEIIKKYYDLNGNVFYTEMQDFFRGTGSDDPNWGDVTYYITGDTIKIYGRYIYDLFYKLIKEIQYSPGDQCKKIIYQYDANNNLINKKEEPIEIIKFWDN